MYIVSWNTEGDILDQYETFNGMPVYYGGDLYDSEDSDWDDPYAIAGETYVEDYNFDVPEGMDLMVHRHRRAPDSSDIQQNWQTDMTPVCRTMPCDTRDEWDMLDDDSLLEAVAADGQNMNEFYQRVVSSDEEDFVDSDDGSVADLYRDMSDKEDFVDSDDEWDMFDGDSLTEAVAADGPNMNELYQRVVSSDEVDFVDSDVGSVTDLDRDMSDEEDCCDSDVADLECLNYLGRNCIMDFSAGGTLSPSESDLTGPNGPYVTDGPVGQIGTLSPSTSSSEILVDPDGTLPSADRAGMLFPAIPVGPVGRWGTLPSSDSDPAGPDGPSVTGGSVAQLGTLSPSTFASAILVNSGGTLPSSDLAGMLLPAIPVGIWGTLSSSDSDPARQDGPHVAGGPVGHLGTLSPSTSESGILVDHGWVFSSSDLAEKRGPAPPAGSAVLRGPVGPAMSLETLLPGVDVPGLCQIVLTVGLLPGVAVPLPAVWDPLFALSPVEELKGTGAEVVGRSLAVRGGWSDPDVAGTSAVVAKVTALNITAPSDRAIGCPAWDVGCHREMVDDWTIYERT